MTQMKWLILLCVLVLKMKILSISLFHQQILINFLRKNLSSEDEFDDAVSHKILSDDEDDEVVLQYQIAIDWSLNCDSEEEGNSSIQTIPVAVEDDDTAVKTRSPNGSPVVEFHIFM
ncbi:hypothetical protein DAPPUDRAFT_328250 [Daphnia pulex]|uniref:Uncharacterized protein n=1 Tax=Daphnia pulex TaxID=6669 RepID=E9HDE7_DAPPU|nr:hypothetical protein DAPPUDRAFT_328250 [Daphnia pulex]|eukprot:EFX70240.1 hypothetical protein DAPPUDRAFT_328250 [Daphnia pulex]